MPLADHVLMVSGEYGPTFDMTACAAAPATVRWRPVASPFRRRTPIAPAFLALIGKRSSTTLSIWWTDNPQVISPSL